MYNRANYKMLSFLYIILTAALATMAYYLNGAGWDKDYFQPWERSSIEVGSCYQVLNQQYTKGIFVDCNNINAKYEVVGVLPLNVQCPASGDSDSPTLQIESISERKIFCVREVR